MSKNAFLIWADRGPMMKEIISKLESNSYQVVYWVGLAGGEKDFTSGVFHEHFSAWTGMPALGVDPGEFPPPGKDLIEKMYKTESVILTMMNKKFDTLCVDERRHIYYSMLGYWHGVIKEYKPEVIIFPAFPHTVYNYIIFSLAKLLGIKTIMFDNPWVANRLILYNDVFLGSRKLKQELEKNKGKNFALADLSLEVREYYEKQIDKNRDVTPIYTKKFKETTMGFKNDVRRLWKLSKNTLKDGTFFRRLIHFISKIGKENLKTEYESVQSFFDAGKNYVYVPLCYQPEATSSPLGDMFVDQILMVEILSAALPKDWVIYVKEHPAQWYARSRMSYSSNRYAGYYRRMAGIKNVKIAPFGTDSYQLIEGARAVAVVTGTVGWEAMLRGKPALAFGYPWYRDCEALFKVYNVESAKEVFLKIIDGYKVSGQDIINYLKSFDAATFRGYLETVSGVDPGVGKEENVENLIKAILVELNRE